MPKAAARTSTKFSSGHSLVRLLIVSYFMAFAIGLIPGTDVTVLADPFMSPVAARVLTGTTVFILASLILVGFQRRAAALLLAIVLFWASYVTMLSANGAQNIGGFWRDLALIGALILTYADTENETQNDAAAVFNYLPQNGPENGKPSKNSRSLLESVTFADVGRKTERVTSKDQFIEDLNHVRAS
ncbi:MAG: hypothetical protein ACR2O1_04255 [Boseongicola sp.]